MMRSFHTPRDGDLGLARIASSSGLSISVLPSGQIFAIEHDRTMVNQVLGSPAEGGIGRLFLRAGGPHPFVAQMYGPGANVHFGTGSDRFVWQGETAGLLHRVTLWLHPREPLCLWRVELTNAGAAAVPCDVILVQDLGLGPRGFLMNNEAFASHYIDHHIARHPRFGPVVMSRQNLAQDGRHPWIAHGCLDGAASFATDASQLFDAAYRDTGRIDPARDLPGERLQREAVCAMLQANAASIEPGATARWTFFALYDPDHALASSDADLACVEAAEESQRRSRPAMWRSPRRCAASCRTPPRSHAGP